MSDVLRFIGLHDEETGRITSVEVTNIVAIREKINGGLTIYLNGGHSVEVTDGYTDVHAAIGKSMRGETSNGL